MIQIITEELDITTDIIIEWLISLGYDVDRKNVEAYNDFTLEITNSYVDGLFKNTFHRRAKLNTLPSNLNTFPYKSEIKSDDNLILRAHEAISKEQGNYVGEFSDEAHHNKILDLYFAREAGFNIPDTLVTNSKSKLLEFITKNNGKVVTKSIKNPLLIKGEQFTAYGRETLLIGFDDVEVLEDSFNLGFFQSHIMKVFEVRVFVYKDSFFSMAIFAEHNTDEVDFRIATEAYPKRYVPFSLPEIVKGKIKKLFDAKNINTGSVDLMVDSNSTFYFLENNSQGQFHWVSFYCNYNIEKHIAIDLINHEKTI